MITIILDETKSEDIGLIRILNREQIELNRLARRTTNSELLCNKVLSENFTYQLCEKIIKQIESQTDV